MNKRIKHGYSLHSENNRAYFQNITNERKSEITQLELNGNADAQTIDKLRI